MTKCSLSAFQSEDGTTHTQRRPRPTWRRFKPNAMGEFIALGSTEAVQYSQGTARSEAEHLEAAGVVQPTQLGNLLPPALPPAENPAHTLHDGLTALVFQTCFRDVLFAYCSSPGDLVDTVTRL